MSLEQDIANVVSAAEQLTGIVDTKIEDINSTVSSKVSEMDSTISQQVTRIDNAINNKHIIGEGGQGTKSFAIAGYFTNVGETTNIHIKLPYKLDTHNCMFHVSVNGYAYGEGKAVDSTFVGYCYKNGNNLIHTQNLGTHEPDSYVGSDNHIYLRLTFSSTYYLTLSVDSIKVGNGTVLGVGDVTIISNPAEKL
ncbi:hypothetical protein [Pseudoalteromonas luteoviolacea]|uniref:hypothetical protein n=1 Tax=Pseudoalteromonas luteoviolacea TaxID=43657 RepID=UPI001151950B|nr:hypothetical protein [Pseudoalteromonas luteoviolacea]TQF71858.1 hypothetical protein FLM44_12555 [Pseudoalteromonas luteoviolacea]